MPSCISPKTTTLILSAFSFVETLGYKKYTIALFEPLTRPVQSKNFTRNIIYLHRSHEKVFFFWNWLSLNIILPQMAKFPEKGLKFHYNGVVQVLWRCRGSFEIRTSRRYLPDLGKDPEHYPVQATKMSVSWDVPVNTPRINIIKQIAARDHNLNLLFMYGHKWLSFKLRTRIVPLVFNISIYWPSGNSLCSNI